MQYTTLRRAALGLAMLTATGCSTPVTATVPAAAVVIADECTGECGQDERTANAAVERAYRADGVVARSEGMPVIIGADALELTVPAHVYGKGPKAGYYLSLKKVNLDGVDYSIVITITDLATVPAKVKAAK